MKYIYESPITYHSKDMANVKVFKKYVEGQGHEIKTVGTNRKVLSCEISITYHSWPMLKFLQTDELTGQKLYSPYFSIRGHKKGTSTAKL
jgi:hypothetical protein